FGDSVRSIPAALIASLSMNHPASSASGGTLMSTFKSGFVFNFATSAGEAEITGLCHFPVAAVVKGPPAFLEESGDLGAAAALARWAGEETGMSIAPAVRCQMRM